MKNGPDENSRYEKDALKSAKILEQRVKEIFDCWLTRHTSIPDKKGIDLVIELWGGVAIYIQILAFGGEEVFSNVSNPNHGLIARHLKRHSNIKNVIVVPRRLLRSPEANPDIYNKIAEELRKIINKAIKDLKEI